MAAAQVAEGRWRRTCALLHPAGPSSKARLMFSAVTGSPRICSLSAAVVAWGTTIQDHVQDEARSPGKGTRGR